jgi:adenylate cyclase
VIGDLNNRLGRDADTGLKISVSIHSGHAAVGEIGQSEPPTLIAMGDAVDVANQLRKMAAEHDKAFAISEKVFDEAGLTPTAQDAVSLRPEGSADEITVYLSDAAPVPSPAWTLHGEMGRRAMLRRLWAG